MGRLTMVGTRASQEVGNQSAGLSNPLLIAGSWLEAVDVVLVLVVVGGVPERGVGAGIVAGVGAIAVHIAIGHAILGRGRGAFGLGDSAVGSRLLFVDAVLNLGQLGVRELLTKTVNAVDGLVVEFRRSSRRARAGSRGDTIKSVVAGQLGKRGAGLLVRHIGLPRVRK